MPANDPRRPGRDTLGRRNNWNNYSVDRRPGRITPNVGEPTSRAWMQLWDEASLIDEWGGADSDFVREWGMEYAVRTGHVRIEVIA